MTEFDELVIVVQGVADINVRISRELIQTNKMMAQMNERIHKLECELAERKVAERNAVEEAQRQAMALGPA